ncbi:MAG TPA: AAA family ATPase [Ktedonobacterales bacterium]|jgi:DNA-binding SARP family transcriptional activator
MAQVALYMFGPPRIEIDHEPAVIDTRKALALFVYLAVTRRPHTRDAIAGLLWPDYDQAHARATLRRTLSPLHRLLGEGYLSIEREMLALRADAALWSDVGAFETLLARCQTHGHAENVACAECLPLLGQAADLYTDSFLAGFALRDSPAFDDWQWAQGERLRRGLASALERLALGYSASGAYDEALLAARRWLSLDRLHEPAHRLLMSIYAWAGQRSAALQQYRGCVQILDEELGVAPLEATTDLYEALRAKQLPPLPELANGNGNVHTSAEVAPATAPKPAPLSPSSPSPLPERSHMPFVGREAELNRLLDAWRQTAEGGCVMIVAGEAGIGKTRLAQEFLRQARAEGAGTLVARCFEGESHLAYGPLAMALRSALPHSGAGWPVRLEAPWAAEIARLLPELPVAHGDVEYLPPIEGPGAQTRFYEALRRALIAACASTSRGIFVLDDAQWADGATLTFLAYLARRITDQPLSMLLLYRTGETGEQSELEHLLGVARKTAHVIVEPGRLRPKDVHALVTAQLPHEQSSNDVATRLYQETEGLPFFLVEYLAAISSGLLAAESHPWSLPGGVRELLRSHLSAASETGWQVMSAAAVLGRSAPYDLLHEVSGRSDDETVAALEELTGRGLLREATAETAKATTPVYDFSHEKLRALVYDEISLARRRLLHRRAAEFLNTRLASRRDSTVQASQVARHYLLAGNDAEAAHYYRVAGNEARDLYANADALEHLRTALALGHPDVVALHRDIGDLETLLGEYSSALASYEKAAALCTSEELPPIEHRLGNVYARRGEWRSAASHYEEAEAASAEAESDAAWQSLLSADWSLAAWRMGDVERARALAAQALRLAEEPGDLHALAQAHNILGILLSEDDAEARAHLEQSLAAATQLNAPMLRVAALNNLAHLWQKSGNLEDAIACAQAALDLCVTLGDRHHEAALHNHLADLLHAADRSTEATAHVRQAVLIYAEIGVEAGAVQPEIWKLSEW